MFGVPTRHVRIAVQWAVFLTWISLIYATHHPMDSWLARHIPVSILLRIDPLVMTVVTGGMRMGITILMLGFVTLAISLLLGRVFCGWVCPLGAIFDFYGWFLQRMRVKFLGPSPKWFRLKYYILLALLIFAAMGAVSPLMGIDPIVLLTRTMAAVINPFWRRSDELTWSVGGGVGAQGYFFDTASLLLFLAIMAGTTRVSRIWCRTTCPLGAYLAIASRHSALRRQTQNCIHCNICSAHCPTGAISFDNAEVYTESECIKCFSCSQECPVDANFFTLKNPLPAVTSAYAPVSLERREVLATSAAAVLAAPALQLSAGEPNSSKTLLRPPMSREERDFLTSCIRCDECVKACPTGLLKPSGIENGMRALWSPVMRPTEGWCMQGCNACSQACPTDAILKYPIEEKYSYKSGTAVFEASRCISHTEGKFCSECIRVCPTNAIQFKKGWEPDTGAADAPGAADEKPANGAARLQHGPGAALVGPRGSEMPAPEGKVPTRPYHVSFEACVGCGACEYVCNQIVMGAPAMVTTSYGRATPTHLPATTSKETSQ